MKLVLDLQGAQGENHARGIGRYSLSLAEAMIRNGQDHDIIVALNGRLTESTLTLRERLAGLLPPDAIKVWTPPAAMAAIGQGNAWLRAAAGSLRENFLADLSPDIVHVSSLFEGLVSDCVTSIGRQPARHATAVTLYDLIPMLHAETYLTPYPDTQRWYLSKLDHLKRADLCLAISESSRCDAIRHLGMAPSQVVAISAAIDDHFRPLDLAPDRSLELRRRLGLAKPFLLYTGGIDPRKNIEGLIRAFALLPTELRDLHQLAVVCGIQDADRARLTALARALGLGPDQLVLTGFVAEQDLVALYNLCRLFVFPSWYEGFGLPALEAMACGAAVIAADSSSLPEVVGRSDTLFAARDDQAMAAKIRDVLVDDGFRNDIKRFGLVQAKKFSWDMSADLALDAMVDLTARQRDRMVSRHAVAAFRPRPARPRLAYVSPLTPARSGIADYSSELLPELSRHYEIEVITHQQTVTDPWVLANCNQRTVAWFDAHAGHYDRILYHFGNSEFHHHMFDLLARHPGVAMLHDFYLSGVIGHGEWHLGDQHGWSRALYHSHGYGALRDRLNRAETAADIVFRYPCSLGVLQQAIGVLVHSDFSRRLTRHWFGPRLAGQMTIIPHLRAPVQQIDRRGARIALGLREDEFIVCSFGLLGPIKLNHRLLSAWLGSDLGRDSHCRLIFVGENEQGDYGRDLQALIAASPAADRVTITGFASPELYRHYLAAADIAVQLRERSRGETSGTILDCLNYGIPTIVNAHGAMADLPADQVVMLQDLFEDADLIAALENLRGQPAERRALGERARAALVRDHAPGQIAALYADQIEAIYDRPRGLDRTIRAAIGPDAPPAGDPAWAGLAQALDLTFPPEAPVKQLLVDISELVRFDAKSGIQRVVRKILGALLAAPPDGFRIEPVYAGMDHSYRYARRFTLDFLGCPTDVLEDEAISLLPGDIFLGLDLQPQIVSAQAAVFQQWRGRGVQICFIVYDLLCIERPDCFYPGAGEGFARWLQVVADSDRALCISAATADSLRRWTLTSRPSRLDHLTIGHFHLGADFVETEDAPTLPAGWSGRPAGPTLLMVGTIEPRKAYQAALTAAEALWREGLIFTLAIVGKVGWMVEPLVQTLRSHAEREHRLFWFEGVDDATLAALYQQADGLLLASEGEGFGLPLVEAAHYGLPILARDLPVFREIGGDRVTYFTDDLTGSLKHWLAALATGTATASTGIAQVSWEDSAALLLAGLLPPMAAATEAPDQPTDEGDENRPGPPLLASQSPLQLYCGYEDEDVALLQRYATLPARVFSDHFIDGFGNKTLFTHVRFCEQFRPSRLQLPVPDDGYHAEAIEYVALVDSIDRAASDHYCVVEIGAAWGPWISLGGTLARRTGRAAITLVGVEADPDRFQLVADQLIANELRPEDPIPGQALSGGWTTLGTVRCRLIQGAAGAREGVLWFPKLNIADLGAAASSEKVEQDYRGADVESYQVKAHSLADILGGVDHVDLLHVDIQGSEFDLLRHNLDLLAAKVDAMLIGTHSRKIEGDLVELLLGAGWRLHREKPCRVNWTLETPDLTGRTITDGCQYWRRAPE